MNPKTTDAYIVAAEVYISVLSTMLVIVCVFHNMAISAVIWLFSALLSAVAGIKDYKRLKQGR